MDTKESTPEFRQTPSNATRYNLDIPVRDLVFKTTVFWVQVHDILVRFMMRKVAEEICDTIREV